MAAATLFMAFVNETPDSTSCSAKVTYRVTVAWSIGRRNARDRNGVSRFCSSVFRSLSALGSAKNVVQIPTFFFLKSGLWVID